MLESRKCANVRTAAFVNRWSHVIVPSSRLLLRDEWRWCFRTSECVRGYVYVGKQSSPAAALDSQCGSVVASLQPRGGKRVALFFLFWRECPLDGRKMPSPYCGCALVFMS